MDRQDEQRSDPSQKITIDGSASMAIDFLKLAVNMFVDLSERDSLTF